jgi:hypothetical protein
MNDKRSLSPVKEWFIIVKNRQEGPFSLQDLKKNPLFNPDSLVWKKGFEEWVKARFVFELQDVFKDDPEEQPLENSEKDKGLVPDFSQDQATLTLHLDPYQFSLWMLLFLLVIVYIIFQISS